MLERGRVAMEGFGRARSTWRELAVRTGRAREVSALFTLFARAQNLLPFQARATQASILKASYTVVKKLFWILFKYKKIYGSS